MIGKQQNKAKEDSIVSCWLYAIYPHTYTSTLSIYNQLSLWNAQTKPNEVLGKTNMYGMLRKHENVLNEYVFENAACKL